MHCRCTRHPPASKVGGQQVAELSNPLEARSLSPPTPLPRREAPEGEGGTRGLAHEA